MAIIAFIVSSLQSSLPIPSISYASPNSFFSVQAIVSPARNGFNRRSIGHLNIATLALPLGEFTRCRRESDRHEAQAGQFRVH